MQNQCAEIKIRAERRGGELIPDEFPHGGDRKTEARSENQTLIDAGITKDQSHRWQTIASMPEEEFERHIIETKDSGEELTSVGIYREARKIEKPIEIISPPLPSGKYRVIVCDPPWPYGTQYDSDTRRVASPYPEMSLEDITNTKPRFANPSVLWLWTTHKFLFDAKEILTDWGFEYKLTFVWNKELLGMGRWLRCQVEFCLLGTSGKLTELWNLTNQRDILIESRREHSRKPEAFYKMVETLLPGPLDETFYLEMYTRKKRSGWYSWGTEIDKF